MLWGPNPTRSAASHTCDYLWDVFDPGILLHLQPSASDNVYQFIFPSHIHIETELIELVSVL